jgi:hypothetical protein
VLSEISNAAKARLDVVGFYFLDLATNYQPPSDLVAFLNAGDTPIYIGYLFTGILLQCWSEKLDRFGSIVVDNPQALTSNFIFPHSQKESLICLLIELIFEATTKAGVRALISAGWVRRSTSVITNVNALRSIGRVDSETLIFLHIYLFLAVHRMTGSLTRNAFRRWCIMAVQELRPLAWRKDVLRWLCPSLVIRDFGVRRTLFC